MEFLPAPEISASSEPQLTNKIEGIKLSAFFFRDFALGPVARLTPRFIPANGIPPGPRDLGLFPNLN